MSVFAIALDGATGLPYSQAMLAAQTPAARFSVTAIVTVNNDEDIRTELGQADSRRKARRIAYRKGQGAVPSRFSRALFDIEIRDTVTGALVPAGWAEREAVARNRAELTVGEVGYW